MARHCGLIILLAASLALPAGHAKAGKDIRATVIERERAPAPPSPDEIAGAVAVLKRIGDSVRRANLEAEACSQDVAGDPQFVPLLPYRLFVHGPHTTQELSNDHLASDAEIQALKAVAPKMHQCHAIAVAPYRVMLPTVAALYDDREATHLATRAKLMEHKINWGQYLTASAVESATYAKLAHDERLRALGLYGPGAEVISEAPAPPAK